MVLGLVLIVAQENVLVGSGGSSGKRGVVVVKEE